MEQLDLDLDKKETPKEQQKKKINALCDNEVLLGAVFDALLYDEGFSVIQANQFTNKIAGRLNLRLNSKTNKTNVEDKAIINLSNIIAEKVIFAYNVIKECMQSKVVQYQHHDINDTRF
jgi:hypothetical protein